MTTTCSLEVQNSSIPFYEMCRTQSYRLGIPLHGNPSGQTHVCRLATNLGLTIGSWTTNPISPSLHGQWSGLMANVVHEQLAIPRLVTAAILRTHIDCFP